MYVRPVAGRLIRDPHSFAAVPADGREVPETPYWLRALAHGDLVLAEPTQTPDTERAA